jgi:hypothetical protein
VYMNFKDNAGSPLIEVTQPLWTQSITPLANITWSLGTSANRWAVVYGQTVDVGNNINVPSVLRSASAAGVSGGSLTLSGGAAGAGTNIIGGNLQLNSGSSTGSSGSVINFATATGGASGTGVNAATNKWQIASNGDLYPIGDALYDIGDPTARVATVYTNNLVCSTLTASTVTTRWSGLASASVLDSSAAVTSGEWYRIAQCTAGANNGRGAFWLTFAGVGGNGSPTIRRWYITKDWAASASITLINQTFLSIVKFV